MGGISCPSTASSSRVFPGPWTQARGSSSAPDSPALRCLWQAADAQTLMTHLSARALRLPRSHSCASHGEIAGAGDSDGKGVSDVDCLVLPRTGGDADPDAAVLVTQWCACAEPLAARAAHRRSSQDCPCSSLPRCLVPFPFFAISHHPCHRCSSPAPPHMPILLSRYMHAPATDHERRWLGPYHAPRTQGAGRQIRRGLQLREVPNQQSRPSHQALFQLVPRGTRSPPGCVRICRAQGLPHCRWLPCRPFGCLLRLHYACVKCLASES